MAGTYMYPNLSPKERREQLRKEAIKSEVISFTRTLSADDLEQEKDTYAREGMRRQQLKDELDGHRKQLGGEIKKIEETQEKRLVVIANEKREETDELYLIPDHGSSRILYVHPFTGEIVNNRPMRYDEHQGNLFLDGNKQDPNVGVTDVPDDVLAESLDSLEEAIKEGNTAAIISIWKERIKGEMPQESENVELEDISEEKAMEIVSRITWLKENGFSSYEFGYNRKEADGTISIASHVFLQDSLSSTWDEWVEGLPIYEPKDFIVAAEIAPTVERVEEVVKGKKGRKSGKKS